MITGKTTIQLTDVNTGEVETLEDHNMITNAFNRIASAGALFGGWADDPLRMQPLYSKFFGGIYLFDDVVPTDAVMIPPGVNTTGAAAYGYADTTGLTQYGSYNAAESEVTASHVKMVFDWGTDRANGDIAAVCLGLVDGVRSGIFGIKGADTSLVKCKYPYIGIGPNRSNDPRLAQMITGYNRIIKYMETEGWLVCAYTDATGGHINADDLKFKTVSILNTGPTTPKAITIPSAASYQVLGYDRTTKKVYFCSTSSITNNSTATIVSVDITDLDNPITASFSFTNKTGATLSVSTNSKYTEAYNGYFYFARSPKTAVYKVKIADFNDVTTITPTVDYPLNTSNLSGAKIYECGGKLYNLEGTYNVGGGIVIDTVDNTVRGYGMNKYQSRYTSNRLTDDGLLGAVDDYNAYYLGCHLAALTTINNLDTPVTKTPDKTMKITYTLEISA